MFEPCGNGSKKVGSGRIVPDPRHWLEVVLKDFTYLYGLSDWWPQVSGHPAASAGEPAQLNTGLYSGPKVTPLPPPEKRFSLPLLMRQYLFITQPFCLIVPYLMYFTFYFPLSFNLSLLTLFFHTSRFFSLFSPKSHRPIFSPLNNSWKKAFHSLIERCKALVWSLATFFGWT